MQVFFTNERENLTMTAKTASKSEAKRVTAQKATKYDPFVATESRLQDLLSRIVVLEAKQARVAESFDFLANECRPIYGMGGLALIFDAVTKRLRK